VGHDIIADRIEAGTFLCAITATGGQALLRGARADHLEAVIDKLRQAGARIESVPEGIRIQAQGRPKAVGFRTSEYPAFPTDMQAQFMVVDCIAEGSATVTETIFENRFMHVQELARLGAKVRLDGDTAYVDGVDKLTGAPVMATDLRASVSLVIGALAAEGQTTISRVYHLDRGFEALETKLSRCGAQVERVSG
jgi:UDP-N-acetylglucosamine 1-carboxyvinyltransferase